MKKDVVDLFMKITMALEGGYVNDPDDAGKATKYGVTLGTLQSINLHKNKDGVINEDDVKLLNLDDARFVVDKVFARPEFMEFPIDVAFLLTDWLWGSGGTGRTFAYPFAKAVSQESSLAQPLLPLQLLTLRQNHFRTSVIMKPTNKKYLKGWSKKNKQAGIRSFSGLNINGDVILNSWPV